MRRLPLAEKYRPRSIDEVAIPDSLKNLLKRFAEQGIPLNLIFAGPPGSGKTSAALALAAEVYGSPDSSDVLFLNASDDRGIDVIRGKVKEFATRRRDGVALIIFDEADELTRSAQQALRRVIEDAAGTARFIFIVNTLAALTAAIQSRCYVVRFPRPRPEVFASAVERIIRGEGIDAEPGTVEALYDVSGGDLRKAINILESVVTAHGRAAPPLVYAAAGEPDVERAVKMIRYIQAGAPDKAVEEARRMIGEGYDAASIASSLFRALWSQRVSLMTVERAAATIVVRDLVRDAYTIHGHDELLVVSAIAELAKVISEKKAGLF